MTQEKENNKPQEDDLLPPFLGSWKKIYAIVLSFLSILIIIFYLMTISLA